MSNDYNNKIYYWIKLKKDFFDLPAIDFLLDQENGCKYIVLYQKLCLLSCNNSGELSMVINDILVPYDCKKIAKITRFDLETVERAVDWYLKLGLVFIQENGAIKINNFSDIVGKETQNALLKKKQRELKKQASSKKRLDNVQSKSNQMPNNRMDNVHSDVQSDVQSNVQSVSNQMSNQNSNKRIEKEIRDIEIIDIEKERENNSSFFANLHKFNSAFADKNLTLSDDLISKFVELNVDELINCVNESDFLKTQNNITLSWLVKNYDKVISGAYKDFSKNKTGDNFSHLFNDFDLSELN